LFTQNRGTDPQNLHRKHLGASPEVYEIIATYVTKELRSHLLAFGCREYGWLPLATAELFVLICCHYKLTKIITMRDDVGNTP